VNMTNAHRAASDERRARRSGFSLLELMIAVAIIVILVGLTLAVITPILLKNEERTTRNVLTQLETAVQEWERTVDRRITFQNAAAETGNWDVPFNPDLAPLVGTGSNESNMVAPFPGTGNENLAHQRTVWMLEQIGQVASVRDLITKIPSQNLRSVRRVNPGPEGENLRVKAVFDAWGTPIIAVFPGRDWLTTDPAVDKDLDGTLRCSSEKLFAAPLSCRNRQVLFVSAGPDQLFTGTGAADNIFSYGQEGQ